MKFLLVEDDPNHSALMTARLEEIGGEVTLAQTVSHAIRALGRSREYDLVVLDQDLPDGKGFEVQACLKGFSDAPSVLFVTCLLYTSPSPRDQRGSRMPSSA